MKILFVLSGNSGNGLDPLIHNQGISIEKNTNVKIEYYEIRGRGIQGYLSNIKYLRRKFKNCNYDLVHAHYSFSAFVASLAGCKPLVVSFMGSDVHSSAFFRYMARVFASLFSWKYVIVKSEEMYNKLGLKRALIIPNGVDIYKYRHLDKLDCRKKLNWDAAKKHILFPANPCRTEKNFCLLNEAIKDLIDVDLHVFKKVPNDETPIWYNAADIVILTSLYEGSPNAIKEAMACNRPIVSTPVGDVKWVIGDIEGCYITSYNANDCATQIKKAIQFSIERGETNGRERINEIGLDNRVIADKIIQIYKEIISDRDNKV